MEIRSGARVPGRDALALLMAGVVVLHALLLIVLPHAVAPSRYAHRCHRATGRVVCLASQ